ncbi:MULTISPECIES: oligoendopeptidase F [Bacillaceae]|uniref:Oligopeptidase F n=1 Tax=Alkalicoccobacillus plakortidis TaxID=444060 RepID=A0A9D5DUZ3_9BACI|nr:MULTISPECIES: oligoendopeptidase F [Bacillaceae]KQL57662.1 oligopeptidase PepB [Alkalicoccobacillus plakortidis]
MAEEKVVRREEVPEESTWDLESIYSTPEQWEDACRELRTQVEGFQKYKGKVVSSASTVFQVLEAYYDLEVEATKILVYARHSSDVDTTNSVLQERSEKGSQLYVDFNDKTAFVQPEILQMSESELAQFLQSYKPLQKYKQYIAFIHHRKDHILSEKEEALLSRLQEPFAASRKTYSLLTNADMTFKTVKDEKGEDITVTPGRFITLMAQPNRFIRKQVYESYYASYEQFSHTIASILSGEVKAKQFEATMRGYDSARAAALDETYIPERVYDQLVETVEKNLPLLHRYMRLRKRLLKLETLHMYDLYTPIVQDVQLPFTYEEAKETMLSSLAPLGDEYVDIVQKGLNERWVDLYENKGKDSGAYSGGSYGTKPFILMNWQDTYTSLSTLTHEFGHSVHSYFTRENQPPVYGRYTIFLAEVASTLNELMLHDYLMKKETTKQKRIYLLNQLLDGMRTTVFRQTMFAEFEHFLHKHHEKGQAITKDALAKAYKELNEKYYGPDVITDDAIAYEWARIPHFFMNYYVYQYATGYSAAVALSDAIHKEGKPAADRFITFLQSGMTDFPIELLKKAGVDMTSKEPVQVTMKRFEDTLNELEELLAE